MDQYFFGQGKVDAALRDVSGNPLAFRWLGDTSSLKVSLSTEKLDFKESHTGQKGLAKSFTIGKSANVEATLMELTKENLALTLHGTASALAGSTVTGETLPADLKVGDKARLKNPKVSAFTLKDSTSGTPKSLVEGTDYQLNADYGSVEILNIGTFVQPFVAAYTAGTAENVSMFTEQPKDLWLRYEGINLAQEGRKCLVELYKVSFDVLKELMLINDKDLTGMDISAGIQVDSTKPATGDLGQYGRIVNL